ncbi:hypothetical protein COCSADRAFT_36213 [Bipolaris sorokiniana ND90Pr]|uniref:PLD phosphodiesterase domain-containing protein n=1 Tax=Cochliobolus sativus (strain ND90Pr / ATCC 201652) TaxID=665912 RepID=M2T783_COCSN|nr:uncharacterized protein COCSADRAFT_36213 [Bipolaris sorokiniana ND90Pr]EMD64837.1 hypothetical protein COCSADRAFT_36213 [Bipolaris sorokiniana ND90Pr]
MQQESEDTPPSKRRRLDVVDSPKEEVLENQPFSTESTKSLDRPISPPSLSKRVGCGLGVDFTPSWSFDGVVKEEVSLGMAEPSTSGSRETVKEKDADLETRFIPSPVRLTRIEKLPKEKNVDTVGLTDLLGDPLIKECWNFNYLFDLDFIMQHFDRDIRDMVKVKIVHGFWRGDDKNRIALLETAERYPNIELISAYIPDPFGTHHSKMLILFRHDDTAQVVIHTANMIHRDWANMTQAVWASPLLPLLRHTTSEQSNSSKIHSIGSGERFKVDLLRYLYAYGMRLGALTSQLKYYDFSSIRAAFLGSAPSKQKLTAAGPSHTAFGWLGLDQILSSIPVKASGDSLRPHIVTQISSVATLGATPTWLFHFQSILSRCPDAKDTEKEEASSSFTKASMLFTKQESNAAEAPEPKFSVVFPTPAEIRMPLDGYTAGGSIHWKFQSVQQQKQLEYMHPILCHWTPVSRPDPSQQEAHRGTAAPHIKTYIRFSDETHTTIDWALLTSANLSKQAWGDVMNKNEEIRVQSWETGVVMWPALFAEFEHSSTMVPVFGADNPETGKHGEGKRETVVGFRMPYNLPLVPYSADERPWCATLAYEEPDRYGLTWARWGR